MEHSNNNLERESFINNFIDDEVRKIVEKVVNESKVPNEQPKNRISVGAVQSDGVKSLYWQPHHLRLYFNFNKTFFNVEKPTLEVGCHRVNSTELEIPDFMEHRIVIKKNQIELTNKVDHKKFYCIRLDSTTRAQQFEIYVKKVNETITVLKQFIKRFGGVSDFKLLNFRCQDKIASEEVVDKLPLKMAFYGELMQKVYNEQNIESKDEPMASVNYIENAALKSVQPEINARLDKIDDDLLVFRRDALEPLTEQIRLHLEVQRETLSTLKAIKQSVQSIPCNRNNDYFISFELFKLMKRND